VKDNSTPAALQSTLGQAEFLRTEGLGAFSGGRFAEAEQLLARLLNRHPAHAGLGETLLRLGQARLELDQASSALSPLRRATGALKGSPLHAESRLTLARAYLLNRKLTQVQLLTSEILNDRKFPEALKGDALLLRAEGQIARSKLTDARLSLSSAASATPRPARLARVTLDLKLAECRLLPSAPRLEEGTFRAELGRRSLCLLEALALLPSLWESEPEAQPSALLTEFRAQRTLCDQPLPPPENLKPKELTTYKEELAQVLKKDCAETKSQAIALLEKRTQPQAQVFLTQLKEAL
jgi:hypothetical protein